MAKKSFINDNPALQFISAAEGKDPAEGQRKTKKTPAQTVSKAPEGYKVNPLYVEVKSRRLQLVLQPSLYDRVKAKAKSRELSVNEYIHQLLERDTREE